MQHCITEHDDKSIPPVNKNAQEEEEEEASQEDVSFAGTELGRFDDGDNILDEDFFGNQQSEEKLGDMVMDEPTTSEANIHDQSTSEPLRDLVIENHPSLVQLDPQKSKHLASQLMEALGQVEQELCYVEGARDFLAEAIYDTRQSGVCGICSRLIKDVNLVDFSATQLQVRQLVVEKTSGSTKSLGQLSLALKRLRPDLPQTLPSPFRRAYLVRVGALGELRAQKQECLVNGECIACSRGFEKPGEIEAFLALMDARAARREEMLHVHVNYCG